MDHLQVGVSRGFGIDLVHVREPIEPVAADQRDGQKDATRIQWMADAVIVGGIALAGDQSDVAAQSTERIAADVRSTIREASSSERQNGGPNMIRSPLVPSAWPVEE